MNVFPKVQIKKVSECEAGSLVIPCDKRVDYLPSLSFLVSDGENCDQRYLVYVVGNEMGICVRISDDEDLIVLAYEGEAFWEIDQSSPIQTSGMNKSKEIDELFASRLGCITCKSFGDNDQNLFMTICLDNQKNLPPRSPHLQVRLDAATLCTQNYKEGEYVSFSGWSLYLKDEEHPFEKVTKMADYKQQSQAGTAKLGGI